ncbi:MAG TPA: hypothetical protein VF713_06820 [Thermoanaerobaculia bacterium]
MASETLDFLMRRYGAGAWLEAQPRVARESVPLRRVSPRTLIDTLQPLRVQEMDVPAEEMDVAGLSRELEGAQRSPMHVTDSTWTPDVEESARSLVHLRTFECESSAAARAQLLQLLAEIQGPIVERTDVAGEVAFATPGNTLIVGVRGNHVFMITNGGEELIDLSRIARTLDERLGGGLPGGGSSTPVTTRPPIMA